MKESVLFHRGNEWEWRFVGIWADMLDKSIFDFDEENKKDFLVLFNEYETPLQVLQENLRLRNLYNQFKSKNSVADIQKMEEGIKNQILGLPFAHELLAYHVKENLLLEIFFVETYHIFKRREKTNVPKKKGGNFKEISFRDGEIVGHD
nr:hypothetical protein [Treponema sp.]